MPKAATVPHDDNTTNVFSNAADAAVVANGVLHTSPAVNVNNSWVTLPSLAAVNQ